MIEVKFLRRGQAGIEYVIMIGILLIFLIPIIYYSLNEANVNIKLTQLENAVRRVVKAADSVHALGPGSSQVVVVTLPKGIQSATIYDKEILLKVSMFGGVSDVHYPSKANLTGTFPTGEGTYNIVLSSKRDGVVFIRQRA